MSEDLDAPPATVRKCVGCNAEPPVGSDGSITLLSLKHGWRLSRKTDASGEQRSEWRCRACWAAYRAKSPVPGRP